MLQTKGLYTYVLNNNLKSLGLLGGFLLIIQLMVASIWAFAAVFRMSPLGWWDDFTFVWDMTWHYAPVVLAASLTWTVLAFIYYKRVVRGMTGLHPVTREQEPRLYNIVENLAISTGLTVPKIEISESDAMNAFAMGLSPHASTIGVTRRLLRGLNDKELEAVIAHEMTHIRTLDVRLMTFATIFCGMIFSLGWFLTYRVRELYRKSKNSPFILFPFVIWIFGIGMIHPKGFPWHGLLLAAALIMAGLGAGLALRHAISRTREFVADAGACELTKNPEALISALVKIHGRSLVPGCDMTVQSMMISAPADGFFATHPTLEQRVDAIVAYAASHLNGLQLTPASARMLPNIDEGAAAMGFSITAMRYPAWISKPIIVLPSLLAGVLAYLMINKGPGVTVGGLFQLPQFVSDVINAPLAVYTFDGDGMSGPDGIGNGKGTGPFGMGVADVKPFLVTLLLAVALTMVGRYLKALGLKGKFIDQITGAPSEEMKNDWEETPSANEVKLNAAMMQRVQRLNAPPEQMQRPLTVNDMIATGQRTTFGKR
jgi:heat shock protein HtpX